MSRKQKIKVESPQRITRKRARECVLHQNVAKRVCEHMILHGYCSKAQILNDLGYETMAGRFKWLYIQEMAEAEIDARLIGVAKAFFNDGPDAVLEMAAKNVDKLFKYIPGGTGRANVGYIAMNHGLDILAVVQVELRQKQASGKANAVVKDVDKMLKGDMEPDNITRLEAIRDKAEKPKLTRLKSAQDFKRLDKLVDS